MPTEVATSIRIRRAALEQVLAHVQATPARESCGVLLGRLEDASRVVEQVVPAVNQAEDVWHEYLIPAERLRRLEDDARAQDLEIVGFYHSHPEGSSEPSPVDLDAAWPWYTYLIVPRGGDAHDVAAWRLRSDRSGFDAETIECTE